MNVVTYNLRLDKGNSDTYYADVHVLTDQVLQKAENVLAAIVADFRQRVPRRKLDTTEELVVEVMLIGVLWRIYAEEARKIPPAARFMLSQLVKLRRLFKNSHQGIDQLTGRIRNIFSQPHQERVLEIRKPSINGLRQLQLWLESTSDFYFEQKKLQEWIAYLLELTPEQSNDVLNKTLYFTDWFIAIAGEILGPYTQNVAHFRQSLKTTIKPEKITRCATELLPNII